MRYSLSFITGTTPVSLLGRNSDPGVGGAQALDALGYSRADHRLYFLEHFDDESGDLPQLHVMHTRGSHFGRMVPVHSWYEGKPEQIEAEFEGRLADLCASLRQLEAAPLSDYRLGTRVVRRRALRLYPDAAPIRKFILKLSVRPAHGESIASIGAQTAVTAYLRPRARLSEVWLVPGEQLAVAIVPYVGVPYELGSEKNAALLVPLT